MGIAGIGRGGDRNRGGNAWRVLRWARGTVEGGFSRCVLIAFLVAGLKRRRLSPPLTVPGYISLMAVTFRFFEGAFPQEKTSERTNINPLRGGRNKRPRAMVRVPRGDPPESRWPTLVGGRGHSTVDHQAAGAALTCSASEE